ncbi:hypothetical protein Sf13_gp111 [Shigella phage Sf13]|uniref:Uncharacterized protein n=1 Tax=Shigella phage Sf13 TaxID=2024316 RepID=A0A291AY29_9CAUD|nr:hypothetical protein FDI44_gp038 [Shigella phage Sf13]ATE85911.1 hypothetical protein Sf13_gp111 [Shigella phage Sf13]
MKKIVLCLFAALSFNAYADMPKVDYNNVRVEACQVAQKVVSKAGELTKPISDKTVQDLTDKIIDLNYRVMGDYYLDVSDMMVTENIDILSPEQIAEIEVVKEHVSQDSMDGVEHFITHRNCVGM